MTVAGLDHTRSTAAALPIPHQQIGTSPDAGTARIAALPHAAQHTSSIKSSELLGLAAVPGDKLQLNRDVSSTISPVGSPAACSPPAHFPPAAGPRNSKDEAHRAYSKESASRSAVVAEAGVQQQQLAGYPGRQPQLQGALFAACQTAAQIDAPTAGMSKGSGLEQASPANFQAHADRRAQLGVQTVPMAQDAGQLSSQQQEILQPGPTAQIGAFSAFGANHADSAHVTEADQATRAVRKETAAWFAEPLSLQAPDILLPEHLPAKLGASTAAIGEVAAKSAVCYPDSAAAGLAACTRQPPVWTACGNTCRVRRRPECGCRHATGLQ